MRMVVVIVAMIVAIPAQMRARHLQQAQLRSLGPHRGSGAVQPWGQLRSRPDQQARILQPARIRGAHLVMMRAGPLRQQNLHLRKIACHLRDQGCGDRGIDDHLQGLGGHRASGRQGQNGKHHAHRAPLVWFLAGPRFFMLHHNKSIINVIK